MTFIDDRPNICTVQLDIPWEVAEALIQHWPGIIGAIQTAISRRRDAEKLAAGQREAVEAACASNIAEWRALAAEFHAEAARRANGPGQKRSIVKQLAAERGMKVSFVEQIMRAFPNEE